MCGSCNHSTAAARAKEVAQQLAFVSDERDERSRVYEAIATEILGQAHVTELQLRAIERAEGEV